MNKYDYLNKFSKFFSNRYRVDEPEYLENTLLGGQQSYKEFLKMSGHWFEENTVNKLHADPSIPYDKDALIGFYDLKTKKVNYKDIFNKYKFNTSGYRMPEEITGKEEIIFSGCSHTVGEGVPEEMVWGVQAANSLGMSWANLAMSGRSPVWCVENIFGYLTKYEAKPKVIALLLPEFDRFQVVNNPMSMICKYTGGEKKHVVQNGLLVANLFGAHHSSNPKYSQRPHWAEDVLNAETTFMYNIRAIKNLAMYCKAAGITFVWSTWSRDDYWILSTYKEDLGIADTFVEIEATSWYSYEENTWIDEYHTAGHNLDSGEMRPAAGGFHHLRCSQGLPNPSPCEIPNCHDDLKEKYGWNFDIGTDKHTERNHSHFGVHKHTHFAEKFSEVVKNKLGL